MKHELVELVGHWLCITKNEFNFLFTKISFGMEMKRHKTLAWETT